MPLKYSALSKLRYCDLKLLISSARKEVKGHSRTFLGQATKYIKSSETRLHLQSYVNEFKINLALINQLEKGETNLEKEKVEVESSLAELESELKALLVTSLDLQQFALAFVESPFISVLHSKLPENIDHSRTVTPKDPSPATIEVKLNQFSSNYYIITAHHLARVKHHVSLRL